MIRLAGLLCLATAAGAALFLFHIKNQVLEMEAELETLHRSILGHREAIHVLNSEWSYLNRPARIADIAERRLGLRAIPANRIVHLEDLPPRPAGAESATLANATVAGRGRQ